MMLCEKLGFASPRHLLGTLTSREVSEWLAYYMVKKEAEDDAVTAAKVQQQARGMARATAMGGKK